MSAALCAFDVAQRHVADEDDVAVLAASASETRTPLTCTPLRLRSSRITVDSPRGDQRVPTRHRSIVEHDVSRRTAPDVHVLCGQEEQDDVLAVLDGQVPPGGEPRHGQR